MRRQRILLLLLVLAGCVPLFFVLRELRNQSRLASCRPDIVYSIARQAAEEGDGLFPPLAPEAGRLMYAKDAVNIIWHLEHDYYCDFDHELRADPLVREAMESAPVNDWSYAYLGYVIEDEAQGLAFVKAYLERVAVGDDFEADLKVEPGKGNNGTDTLYRLRSPGELEALSRNLGEQAASIPVVIEWPRNHRPIGGKVVFLDGHTKYLPYPGPFPMTEAFIDGLMSLDALGADRSYRPDNSD